MRAWLHTLLLKMTGPDPRRRASDGGDSFTSYSSSDVSGAPAGPSGQVDEMTSSVDDAMGGGFDGGESGGAGASAEFGGSDAGGGDGGGGGD